MHVKKFENQFLLATYYQLITVFLKDFYKKTSTLFTHMVIILLVSILTVQGMTFYWLLPTKKKKILILLNS
jgi:hypothetical protein